MKITLPFKLNYKDLLFVPFLFVVLLYGIDAIEAAIDYLLPEKPPKPVEEMTFKELASQLIRKRREFTPITDLIGDYMPRQLGDFLKVYFHLFLLGNIPYSIFKIFKNKDKKAQLTWFLKSLACSSVLYSFYILKLGIYRCGSGVGCTTPYPILSYTVFWLGLLTFLSLTLYQRRIRKRSEKSHTAEPLAHPPNT